MKSGKTGTVVSLMACVLALLGFVVALRRRIGLAEVLTPVTLAIVVAWPFMPFRFTLPLLPFALSYVLFGMDALGRRFTGPAVRSPGCWLVAALATVSVVANVEYTWRLHGPAAPRPFWEHVFEEHLDVIRWVHEHVPPDQVVAAKDPALVYLYNGHRTVGYWQPTGTWREWRRLGVHYLVDTSYLTEKDDSLWEGRFLTVHRSATMNLRVLDLRRIYEPH